MCSLSNIPAIILSLLMTIVPPVGRMLILFFIIPGNRRGLLAMMIMVMRLGILHKMWSMHIIITIIYRTASAFPEVIHYCWIIFRMVVVFVRIPKLTVQPLLSLGMICNFYPILLPRRRRCGMAISYFVTAAFPDLKLPEDMFLCAMILQVRSEFEGIIISRIIWAAFA